MATKIKEIDNLEEIAPSKLPLVIGYFGSVHVMHTQLFYKFHRYNVLTFKDFRAKAKTQLYTYSERIDNIAAFKPKNIFVYDIKKRNMKGEDFIQQVLIPLQPSEIVVGSNFKFGSDHQSVDLLRKYFDVITINHNKSISSTSITKLLSERKIGTANSYLATPYYYVAKWVKGFKIARQLGYPTINLQITHFFPLADGSYITRTKIGNRTFQSVTFVGASKTLKRKDFHFETYVIGKRILPRSLYPSSSRDSIKTEFLSYLRQNFKFKNKKQLSTAIAKDVARAKAYFARIK